MSSTWCSLIVQWTVAQRAEICWAVVFSMVGLVRMNTAVGQEEIMIEGDMTRDCAFTLIQVSAAVSLLLSIVLFFSLNSFYWGLIYILWNSHYNCAIWWFFLIDLFICLFFGCVGFVFHCCTRTFSSCLEQGLLFIAVHRLLIAVASLVVEHGL